MKFSSSSSSLSSLVGERKSTLCIYTEPEIVVRGKIDMESATLRQRLEAAEGALKLQTVRCCQLVTEYTSKLQRKDEQLCCEQQLRDTQLSYVLRALRLFEDRLQREQKNIRQLLLEKDNVISGQKTEILRLRTPVESKEVDNDNVQYCHNCQTMFTMQNSLSLHDKQSVVSGSSGEDCSSKSETGESACGTYTKHRPELTGRIKTCSVRRSKKSATRKQSGELRRHEAMRPFSSSSDEQEERSVETNAGSAEDEVCFRRQPSFSNWVDSLHGIKRIREVSPLDNQNTNDDEVVECENTKNNEISTTDDKAGQDALVNGDETKLDENWYTNTSDAEETNAPEPYKDNPVLECVNQILLQNSLEVNSSEDSSPKLSPKRVQFAAKTSIMTSAPTAMQVPKGIISNSAKSSEHSPKSPKMVKFNLEAVNSEREYETPIECFNYEIQSIYSNDYEPIGNQQHNIKNTSQSSEVDCHYYMDMDTSKLALDDTGISKISKIPPALPPKPPNLISKYKIHRKLEANRTSSDVVEHAQQINEAAHPIPEPDYCSISEINEQIVEKPIQQVKTKPKFTKPRIIETQVEVHEVDIPIAKVAPVTRIQAMGPEHLEKPVDSDNSNYISADIPKLPQVSEILIPKEDRFGQDNYIKNNSTILKCSKLNQEESRFQNTSIQIGNSVSNILTEIKKKHIPKQVIKYETNQEKTTDQRNNNEENDLVLQTFENYDLSQTFEEFKLDESDINDMEVEEYLIGDNQDFVFHESDENEEPNDNELEYGSDSVPSFELSKNTLLASQFMRTQLIPDESLTISNNTVLNDSEKLKCPLSSSQDSIKNKQNSEEYKHRISKNYETFLETSGLSSKSLQNLYKANNLKLRVAGKPVNRLKPGTTVKYWSGPYL